MQFGPWSPPRYFLIITTPSGKQRAEDHRLTTLAAARERADEYVAVGMPLVSIYRWAGHAAGVWIEDVTP